MQFRLHQNRLHFNGVITAMVGLSYPVNLGMLFTIFPSVHTQRNMSFNARTLYRMFDQRKTIDISTGL
jgi:methionine aminopeptidase